MPEEISKIFKYAPSRAEIFGVCRLLIIVNRTDCGTTVHRGFLNFKCKMI